MRDQLPRGCETQAGRQLLREAEVAAILGSSAKTLNVARARGVGAFSDLPWLKFGKSLRIAESDLTSYIEAHRIGKVDIGEVG